MTIKIFEASLMQLVFFLSISGRIMVFQKKKQKSFRIFLKKRNRYGVWHLEKNKMK